MIAMPSQDMPGPLAAIDIGTNTIRLLVARPQIAGDTVTLQPLADRTETVRLGHGVERTGRIAPERLERAVATVEAFRQVALTAGARAILVAATSAVRDAANGSELRERIAATSGLTVPIVDGAREAALTFIGATVGQDCGGVLVVCDLGGGSLELIAAEGGALRSATSLQLGSGRLTERHIVTDPPGREAIAAAEADARAILAPAIDSALVGRVDRLLIVGGTATSLLVLTPKPDGSRVLSRRRLDGAEAILTGTSVARVAADTGLDPERVRTLPAGLAIVRAVLAAYDLDAALVGAGGIREGLIVDYVRNAAGRVSRA